MKKTKLLLMIFTLFCFNVSILTVTATSTDNSSVESDTDSENINSDSDDDLGTTAHYILANDYKTDSNSWADAIEEAFVAAEQVTVQTVTHFKAIDQRMMTFSAYPTVKLEPGEYEIDRTITVGRNINFDFTDAHFFATEGQEQSYDALNARDRALYNHYKMPYFHNFRRNFVFSTQNNDAVILIEGGGSYGSLNHIDSLSYHSSRSTTLTIRNFESTGTNQVLRIHEDNALVENATIEHTGWNGSAIFNQGRTRISNVHFIAPEEAPNEKEFYGLIESWTTSEPEQLINPATQLPEDQDPHGNANPGHIGAVNRSISIEGVTVDGNIPLVVWEGENWQDFSTSNAFRNAIIIKDTTLNNHVDAPLILINRDLPAIIQIERTNGYQDDNVPYIYFSELSQDEEHQTHQNNTDGNNSIDEHNNIYENAEWAYAIHFGEGNDATETNVSNDKTVNRFVHETVRSGATEFTNQEPEELDLYWVRDTQSDKAVNAADFKTDTNTWAQAINEAIQYAAKDSTHDNRNLVVLTPGKYLIDETINVPETIDIDFSGSLFYGVLTGRADVTAMHAEVRDNAFMLPGFIGFDIAFEYTFSGQEGHLLVERAHFFNNRIDLTDTGFTENRYGQVHLESLRSTASDNHIVTNASDTLYKGSWIYQSSANQPSIISNSNFKLTNFVGVPYPLLDRTIQDNIAWVAQYNEGEGITEEEKNHRGVWLDNGVFGGEPGSRILVRSFMEKTDANTANDSVSNHIILSFIVGEAGNQNHQPRSLISIERDLPSYIKMESINGMTIMNDGVIHFQEGASTDHQNSTAPGEYIIYRSNTANIKYPHYTNISLDESLDQLLYEPIPMDQADNVSIDATLATYGNDQFVSGTAIEGSNGLFISERSQ